MRSMAIVLLSLILGGQASSPTRGAIYEWYFGKSQTFDSKGVLLGTSEAMCRRRLFPSQGVIIEQVVSFGRDGRPTEFVTVFNVSGKVFKMVEANGSFTGHGELDGDEWNWSHWHSSSILESGSSVDSDDKKNGDGFVAKKEIRSPGGGALLYRIVETYQRVSETAYMERYKKLFP